MVSMENKEKKEIITTDQAPMQLINTDKVKAFFDNHKELANVIFTAVKPLLLNIPAISKLPIFSQPAAHRVIAMYGAMGFEYKCEKIKEEHIETKMYYEVQYSCALLINGVQKYIAYGSANTHEKKWSSQSLNTIYISGKPMTTCFNNKHTIDAMAKKRAEVALARAATALSDLTADQGDLPDEGPTNEKQTKHEPQEPEAPQEQTPPQEPQEQEQTPPPAPTPSPAQETIIKQKLNEAVNILTSKDIKPREFIISLGINLKNPRDLGEWTLELADKVLSAAQKLLAGGTNER